MLITWGEVSLQHNLHRHLFNGLLSRTTRVSRYQIGKTNLDLLEQETVSGSGISWAICKFAPRPMQIAIPARTTQFYRPYPLPAAQPTASKHWMQPGLATIQPLQCSFSFKLWVGTDHTCRAPSCPEIPEMSQMSWNCPEISNCPEILLIWSECPDMDLFMLSLWHCLYFVLYLVNWTLSDIIPWLFQIFDINVESGITYVHISESLSADFTDIWKTCIFSVLSLVKPTKNVLKLS